MLLYHGTSAQRWKEFLIHGIRPPSLSGESNWNKNPNPNGVYLSTIMAPYYALSSWLNKQLAGQEAEPCLIVEVDTCKPDPSGFAPDDDFLVHKFPKRIKKDHDLRHRIMEKHRDLWLESLEVSAQVAYIGTVPPEAFTRYAIWPSSVVEDIGLKKLDLFATNREMKGHPEKYECKVLGLLKLTEHVFTEPKDGEVRFVANAKSSVDGLRALREGIKIERKNDPWLSFDFAKVQRAAIEHFRRCHPTPDFTVHGPDHWQRVERNALSLARATGADKTVVRLFAMLHDCARIDDGYDVNHGPAAADLIEQWQGHLFNLDSARLTALTMAVRCHTQGLTSLDATIGTCWDADRLDLPRVGISPHPTLLSTVAARKMLT